MNGKDDDPGIICEDRSRLLHGWNFGNVVQGQTDGGAHRVGESRLGVERRDQRARVA